MTGPQTSKWRSGLWLSCALSLCFSLIPHTTYAQDLAAAKAAGAEIGTDNPERLKGAKPAPKSLEDGIWVETAKAEFKARTSGERTQHSELETYTQSVMDKVLGDHVGEARVYVMERPFFNASMAPNGYTEIWTGLLLRVQTEDELAFVLGHEAGHYLHSHSLRAYQNFKDTQNAALAASIVISVIAMGAAANANTYNAANNIGNMASGLIDIIYLGTIAAYFGYSRDMEGNADLYGYTYAAHNGYSPLSGATLWRDRLAETAASDFEKVRKSPTRINIFGSHPLETERVEALETYDKVLHKGASSARYAEDERMARLAYRERVRPYLAAWLKDDLRRQDYGQTLHIIDRLSQDGADAGLLNFYRGEALRHRSKDNDLQNALSAYQEALNAPDAPAETHRQMAEVYRRLDQKTEAIAEYKAYLAVAPYAEDAWIIEDLISSMQAGVTPAGETTP